MHFNNINNEIEHLPKNTKLVIWNYQSMMQNFANYQVNQFVQHLIQLHDAGSEMVRNFNDSEVASRIRTDSGVSSHEHAENSVLQASPPSTPNEKLDEQTIEMRDKLDQLQYHNVLPGYHTIYDMHPETSQVEVKWQEIRDGNLKVNGNKHFECAFCRKNGELPVVYKSHSTKDDAGVVTCPILQEFVCKLCGATGQYAHTKKYCPKKPQSSQQQPALRVLANGVVVNNRSHK